MRVKPLALSGLSAYRAQFMGLAILWTMFYHAVLVLPKWMLPLVAFKTLGIVGVDIFFLLSGLGLSFSWKSQPQAMAFWRKRFARVVPVFWLFVSLSLLKKALEHGLVPSDAGRFLGLDFFLWGDLDRWFVPSILLCYVLFPLLAGLARRVGPVFTLFGCSALAWCLSVMLIGTPMQHLQIFTVRLPAFCLGMYAGHVLAHKASAPWLERPWLVYSCLLLGMCMWVALQLLVRASVGWHYGLWWYPTVILAYPLCQLAGRALAKWRSRTELLQAWLARLGGESLEIYLTHAFVFSLAVHMPFQGSMFNPGRVPEYLAYSVLSLWLAPRVARLVETRFGLRPS
jgi:peptidoglycan/LPS O-acetylase OafA/YrhL